MAILCHLVGLASLLSVRVSQGSIVGAVEIASGGIIELNIYDTT